MVRCLQYCSASSRPPEQACRPYQQHESRDQIENREFDLREKLDAGRAHEAHDERADQGAFEAAESADDHDDECEDQCLDAHAKHGCLRRYDDRTSEASHEATKRKCLDVNPLDVKDRKSTRLNSSHLG